MNIAECTIKNNRISKVLLLFIVAAGLSAYFNMPREENPAIPVQEAVVLAQFPGAASEKVERLLTEPLEEAIQTLPEVFKIESQSIDGLSIILVTVREDITILKPIWDRLRIKVAEVALPDGALPPYVNDEFGDVFGMLFALTVDVRLVKDDATGASRWEGLSYRELEDIADHVKKRLLRIPGVGKVELHGVQDECIFVEVSNARAGDSDIIAQLSNIMVGRNTIQRSGRLNIGPERVTLETSGEFRSIDDIRRISLAMPGTAESLCLEDVAEVKRSYQDPPLRIVLFNGKPAVVIAVNMAEGGNIIELGERVRAELAQIEQGLPLGFAFQDIMFQPKFVNRNITDFTINLIEAFILILVVMTIFSGWRAGVVTGTLVPMAIFFCLMLMPLMGVILQQVALAALIISLGILVDNGVVMSEEIVVRLNRGEERTSAAVNAVRTLWLPLLSGSLTTIAAFLPIFLAKAPVGEYTRSIFIVVLITLTGSWLLSLTMIPMLCRSLLSDRREASGDVDEFSARPYQIFRSILLAALHHRLLLIALTCMLVGMGVYFMARVPTVFFPPALRECALVDFLLPYGTNIRETEERMRQFQEKILQDERVESVAGFVGYGGPRWSLMIRPEQPKENYAYCMVNLKNVKDVRPYLNDLRRLLNSEFPELRGTVKELENGPAVGSPIQIRLSGDDMRTLYGLRDRVLAAIGDVPGLCNVRDDWGEWGKKVELDINQQAARRAGLSSVEVARAFRMFFDGLPLTEYREGTKLIPVVLRNKDAERRIPEALENINIFSSALGAAVALDQISGTRVTWQPSNIRRRNMARTMTIKGDVAGRFASAVLADIQPLLAEVTGSTNWPAGCSLEYGGEQEESARAQAAIAKSLPLAGFVLLLILIAQFNSIRRVLIILLSIPPMVIGFGPGLYLTRSPFGFMAMLGVISLMGIVVNNAIMLIDRIEIERRESKRSVPYAIVTAAVSRLRPIFMTTLTTVAGLIPLSLQGGDLWRSMANVLIFGLISSTAVTLLVCPVLYSLLFGVSFQKFEATPAQRTVS